MRHLALLALLLTSSIPRATGACDRGAGDGGPHRRDPQHSTDATPPSAVTASFDVFHDDSGSGGCGNSCNGDYSNIELDLQATDDRTTRTLVGYQLAIVSGQPPNGIDLPDSPLLTNDGGHIQLRFDGSDRAFAFDLEIRAVDLNGNLGPPTVITIVDPA